MTNHDWGWNGGSESAGASTKTTRGAVRYRDGRIVVMDVLRRERMHLLQAGFSPHQLVLQRDDGSRVESELWTQDDPCLADYLNAANLLFGDEPGSLSWHALSPAPDR